MKRDEEILIVMLNEDEFVSSPAKRIEVGDKIIGRHLYVMAQIHEIEK